MQCALFSRAAEIRVALDQRTVWREMACKGFDPSAGLGQVLIIVLNPGLDGSPLGGGSHTALAWRLLPYSVSGHGFGGGPLVQIAAIIR